MLFGGILTGISSFFVGSWSGFFMLFFIAVLTAVFGFLLLTRPLLSAEAITIAMAFYYLVSGIFLIVAPLFTHTAGWGWLAVYGKTTVDDDNPDSKALPALSSEDNARAERSLGRAVSIGLPVTCVAVAVLPSVAGSVGPALLVLASGALLGAIALVWASIRTLSGDAPLSVGLELAATRQVVGDDLLEQKRRVLRACFGGPMTVRAR